MASTIASGEYQDARTFATTTLPGLSCNTCAAFLLAMYTLLDASRWGPPVTASPL